MLMLLNHKTQRWAARYFKQDTAVDLAKQINKNRRLERATSQYLMTEPNLVKYQGSSTDAIAQGYKAVGPFCGKGRFKSAIHDEILNLERYTGYYQLFNVRVGMTRYLDIYALVTEPIRNPFASRAMSAWNDKYPSLKTSGKEEAKDKKKRGKMSQYARQKEYIERVLMPKERERGDGHGQ